MVKADNVIFLGKILCALVLLHAQPNFFVLSTLLEIQLNFPTDLIVFEAVIPCFLYIQLIEIFNDITCFRSAFSSRIS